MKHPAERLLDLLNFYGVTFGRLCTDDPEELGQTAATLVSAVLGCRISMVFLGQSGETLRLVGVKGLDQAVIHEWPAGSPFAQMLWERVEHAGLVRGFDLGIAPQSEALAQGLGDAWLVAPIRDTSPRNEERIGLLVACKPRQPIAPELMLMALDILGSFVSGALASLRALSELSEANRALAEQVAERNRAEQEIRRLNQDLERKVAERTSELSAANRELLAFSYSVSHDLRAPLRSIDGFSQALLEDAGPDLGPEPRAHLARIRAAAQRMGQLIDDMLQLSKVTRAPLHDRPVDLAVLARETAQALRAGQPSRDVTLVIAETLPAQGDARLLRMVIDNLMSNAWKFTRRQPRARIEIGMEMRDGQPAYFVRDEGAGFDPKEAVRLFRPFQRLHSEREFEGTGVGLSIVQRIVHRHGGRVWAEGAVGRGATFWFTLGRAPDRAADEGENRAPANAPPG